MIDENEVIDVLKQCHDPEIPVDLWSLGLIYDISICVDEYSVDITHTLTSAFCPFADEIVNNIRQAGMVQGVEHVEINTVFDPPFTIELRDEVDN